MKKQRKYVTEEEKQISAIERQASISPLAKKLKEGGITLEEEVIKYEKEFFRLANKKRLEDEEKEQFEKSGKELCTTINSLESALDLSCYRLSSPFRVSPSAVAYYRTNQSDLKKKQLFNWGTLAALGGIFTIAGAVSVFPPVLILFWSTFATLTTVERHFDDKREEQKKKRDYEGNFEGLKKDCSEIDQAIHSLYIMDYYKKSLEESTLVKYTTKTTVIFMDTFERLSEYNKKKVIKEILQTESNHQINKMLSEKYPELIKDVCRDTIFENDSYYKEKSARSQI